MKLRRFLLRYYPPGIILEYEQGGEVHRPPAPRHPALSWLPSPRPRRATGQPIDKICLLRYIISYRNQQDYHEQCVERIYSDIFAYCAPIELEVYARYTRRGGLDINPYRSSKKIDPPLIRISRQ